MDEIELAELEETRLLLNKWSRFASGIPYSELGYPQESIEHKAIFGGGVGGYESWPDDVLQMENALIALGHENKIGLKAIKKSYLGRGMGLRALGLELGVHWEKARDILLHAELRSGDIYLEIKHGRREVQKNI